MKAFRYVVSALSAMVLVGLGSAFSGLRLAIYVDAASAILALGIPLVLLKAEWSFKAMGSAFKNALSDRADRAGLEDARLFFRTAFRYLLATGPVAFFMGLIAILGNLSDQAKLGPNLAVALLSMFYVLIAGLVVCLPLEAAAERRIKALRD